MNEKAANPFEPKCAACCKDYKILISMASKTYKQIKKEALDKILRSLRSACYLPKLFNITQSLAYFFQVITVARKIKATFLTL